MSAAERTDTSATGVTADRHLGLVRELGAYAQQHFSPIAERWDRENRFPTENYAKLQSKGWLRIPVSRRFGGMGFGLHEDPVAWVSLVRELSKACGNTGQTFQIWGHCMSMIEELATPEQAARFVKEAMGGAIW
jgi:alkylation response protein AidB-like acyl-CoA dehydrogenase